MTPDEHLDAIERHLTKLLEIAKKRTPGKWKHNEGRRMLVSVDSLHEDAVLYGDEFEVSDYDAIYIAACAGNAEAGWEALLAFISSARRLRVRGHSDEAARITHPIKEMFPAVSLTHA